MKGQSNKVVAAVHIRALHPITTPAWLVHGGIRTVRHLDLLSGSPVGCRQGGVLSPTPG